LSDPSDELLLAAYRKGDSGAFEVLLGRYRTPIFNFLLRSARDRGRAEELYQDVWMKVIERCGEFRGDAKFSTWLYTIARNLVSSFGPSTEQLAIGGLIGERIARAVEGLPDEQREVFLLRQLQGLAFREISEVVGAPANTVKSRMRYALERLQQILSDLEEPHEL
jgi:RNA polymerase sigma-70 factor (ECF subfamily)